MAPATSEVEIRNVSAKTQHEFNFNLRRDYGFAEKIGVVEHVGYSYDPLTGYRAILIVRRHSD